ncbi:TetR-like C-terminal domain-containing protein [Lactobacillus corticis]|nr:TetR-like C-terminal domain-containing protein [Lactobacillus corticis]
MENISISQLTNEAQVGRSTFYRNFDELIDILTWKSDDSFSDVLKRYIDLPHNPEKMEYLGFVRFIFNYWYNNSEVFEILISINRVDIIYKSFNRASPMVVEYMQEKGYYNDEISPVERSYFLSMRISILIGTLSAWISGGKKEDPDEIVAILGKEILDYKKMKVLF